MHIRVPRMVRLPTGRLAARLWHYTSDGILVLRYPHPWPSQVDAMPALLRRGGLKGPTDLPVLVDLRRLDPDEPVRQLRCFLLELPALARRIPQRRAYLVRDPAQEDLVRMIQSGTAPRRSEARVFKDWIGALDWLRGCN